MSSTNQTIEQFMAANLFYCGRLCARITVQQCGVNQRRDLYLCGSCPTPETSRQTVKRPRQRHKGDNPASPWRSTLYNRAALAEHEAEQAAAAAIQEPTPEPEQSVSMPVKAEENQPKRVGSGRVGSGRVGSGRVGSGRVPAAVPSSDTLLILQIMAVKHRSTAAIKALKEMKHAR